MSNATIRMGVISTSLENSEKIGKELLRCVDQRLATELMAWTWKGRSSSDADDLSELDQGDLGQLVFVDDQVRDLEFLLNGMSHLGRAVFLVTTDSDSITKLAEFMEHGIVDDVLVQPFRKVDVFGKLKLYHQIMAWNEVRALNESFSQVVEHLHEDLAIAEQIQKRHLPVRFPDIKGFKTYSRYMAGKKAGGDFFDVAEYPGGFGLLLSDSSSYGLSSAVLSILMKVASRLSADQSRSTSELFIRIQEEVKSVLKFRDHLSLFYGNLSYQNWTLRYLNLGNIRAFYAPKGGVFAELDQHGGVIVPGAGMFRGGESEVQMLPGSRLVLASDGFIKIGGGSAELQKLLNEKRDLDPRDAVNELVFRVKAGFSSEDDVPEEDCTMIALDADTKQLKLVG